MDKKYIIDTDFLPQELTHYHGVYSDEMTEDLYQIVYGILQDKHSLSNVYEVVIRNAYRQRSAAIRKFKLRAWKKYFDNILKVLGKISSNDYEVIVYVPIRQCVMSMSAAQSYFQLANFTIDELLESESVPVPDSPDEPLVPDMKKLFEDTYSGIFTMLDNHDPVFTEIGGGDDGYYDHAIYWQSIIYDEMYRRGIDKVKLNDSEINIHPSEYYGDPSMYKDYSIEKSEQLELNSESEGAQNPDVTTATDNDSIQTRAAVMYFMLNSFCPVTDENFNRAVAMIDFAVGKQTPKYNANLSNDTEINKVNNKNSIKKYVRNCRDTKNYLELPTSDKVRERLAEQGFEIPATSKTKNP